MTSKHSTLTRPLAVALSAVRRAQQFSVADITAGEERRELDAARAAVCRAAREHSRRLALGEKWAERIVANGDISLPTEELLRGLLDFAAWLRAATENEPEMVRDQAGSICRAAVRIARDWCRFEGTPPGDLDARLVSEAFFRG